MDVHCCDPVGSKLGPGIHPPAGIPTWLPSPHLRKVGVSHLDDGLQLLDFGLQHLILSLQFQDLLLLGPVLNVILELEGLISLQLALLLHLIQPVFELIDLKTRHVSRGGEDGGQGMLGRQLRRWLGWPTACPSTWITGTHHCAQGVYWGSVITSNTGHNGVCAGRPARAWS